MADTKKRDTGATQDNINFPVLRARLGKFLNKNHPEYDPNNAYAFDVLLDFPDFGGYLETFLESDFLPRIITAHTQSTILPQTYPEIKLAKVYKTFMSAVSPENRMTSNIKKSGSYSYDRLHVPSKPQRRTSVYPLTMDQTERALLFLQQNDDYLFSINALKACLREYIIGVRDLFEDDFDLKVTPQISDSQYTERLTASEKSLYFGYNGLKSNAESFVLTHDLAIQIASTILKEDTPFSDHSMTKGIRGLFKIQAFQSAAKSAGNAQRDFKQCPFKDGIIDMLRTKLDISDDGKITASMSSQHGQLILDIRRLVRDRYFQAWSPPGQTELKKRRIWPFE